MNYSLNIPRRISSLFSARFNCKKTYSMRPSFHNIHSHLNARFLQSLRIQHAIRIINVIRTHLDPMPRLSRDIPFQRKLFLTSICSRERWSLEAETCEKPVTCWYGNLGSEAGDWFLLPWHHRSLEILGVRHGSSLSPRLFGRYVGKLELRVVHRRTSPSISICRRRSSR